MKTKKVKLRRLYDITSKFYDELYGYEQIRKFRSIFSLELLRSSKFKTMLDAGCGTGLVVERLRSKGAFVVGIDFSKGMLRKAKKRINKAVEVDLVLGDVERLPFRSKAFDLVVSLTVVQNCNPLRALKSLLRVVLSDGILVLSYPKRSKEMKVLEARLHDYILRDLDPIDNVVILNGRQRENLKRSVKMRVKLYGIKDQRIVEQDKVA